MKCDPLTLSTQIVRGWVGLRKVTGIERQKVKNVGKLVILIDSAINNKHVAVNCASVGTQTYAPLHFEVLLFDCVVKQDILVVKPFGIFLIESRSPDENQRISKFLDRVKAWNKGVKMLLILQAKPLFLILDKDVELVAVSQFAIDPSK